MCARSRVRASVFLALVLRASAHSFLLAPRADWINYNQPECRLGGTDGYSQNCGGPCGIDGNFFDQDQDPVIFTRGQIVNMQWARNNHFSGFVRFTLVPKSQRMNFGTHEKFAFRYACWEAGKASCVPGEFCGTDMQGIKYTANVQIPPVYPDGDYVLGWSWYGGSRYFSSEELKSGYGIDGNSGHRSEYGDYFSCVNVRIQGGMDIQNEYKPIFETGQADGTNENPGTCRSAVNKLFDCKGEPCSPKFSVTNMVPSEFDGRSPAPIKRIDMGGLSNGARLENQSFQSPPPGQQSVPNSDTNSSGNWTSRGGGDQGAGSSSVDIVSLDVLNTDDQSVVSSTMMNSAQDINLKVKQGSEHFSLRANAVGNVRDVLFVARLQNNGAELLNRKEEKFPYYLNGDQNGNGKADAWQNVPVNNLIDLSITVTSTSGNQKTRHALLYLDATTGTQ